MFFSFSTDSTYVLFEATIMGTMPTSAQCCGFKLATSTFVLLVLEFIFIATSHKLIALLRFPNFNSLLIYVVSFSYKQVCKNRG